MSETTAQATRNSAVQWTSVQQLIPDPDLLGAEQTITSVSTDYTANINRILSEIPNGYALVKTVERTIECPSGKFSLVIPGVAICIDRDVQASLSDRTIAFLSETLKQSGFEEDGTFGRLMGGIHVEFLVFKHRLSKVSDCELVEKYRDYLVNKKSGLNSLV